MIQKYVYGNPFPTEAVVTEVPAGEGSPAYGQIKTEEGFCFTYIMEEADIALERPIGALTNGDTAISAIAPTILSTRRTSGLCTARTILSSYQAKRPSGYSSTIPLP